MRAFGRGVKGSRRVDSQPSKFCGTRLACLGGDSGLDHLPVDSFCVPVATNGHAVSFVKLLLACIRKGNRLDLTG